MRTPVPIRVVTDDALASQTEPLGGDSGLTLIELIIVCAILSLLATMAVPVARFQVKRIKERELRADLWEMRSAIDHYKDAADKGGMQIKTDSFGYPPDLQTMVDGVEIQTNKVKFLRRIPVDPMTGNSDWGLRAMQETRIQTPGAARTSLMCIPRTRARRSTGPSTTHVSLSKYVGSQRERRGRDGGFTLIELMIVMTIIGILAAIAIPSYVTYVKKAKEAVLREDLHVLRSAIDSYTNDKQKAPQTLEDLVQGGYINAIPQDPMTHRSDTWNAGQSDSYVSIDETDSGGINDVHSGSQEVSTEGTSYGSW